MTASSDIVLMRIFISTTDKYKGSLLYEKIVFDAKKFGLAGATVVKGILGFGASSVVHSYKFWEVSEKLPVVVELVDEKSKLFSFYETIKPILETMKYGCLVTTERVDVLLYKSGKRRDV